MVETVIFLRNFNHRIGALRRLQFCSDWSNFRFNFPNRTPWRTYGTLKAVLQCTSYSIIHNLKVQVTINIIEVRTLSSFCNKLRGVWADNLEFSAPCQHSRSNPNKSIKLAINLSSWELSVELSSLGWWEAAPLFILRLEMKERWSACRRRLPCWCRSRGYCGNVRRGSAENCQGDMKSALPSIDTSSFLSLYQI